MSTSPKEFHAKLKGILGVSTPFAQGGSWRLTIPKRMAEKWDLRQKNERYFGFIFVETDNKEIVLLVPLKDVPNPTTVQNALSFMDLSRLTKQDIELLFEEE